MELLPTPTGTVLARNDTHQQNRQPKPDRPPQDRAEQSGSCAAGLLALHAAAPIIGSALAHAAPDTVYFSYSGYHCAIMANGAIGCDMPERWSAPVYVGGSAILAVPAPQILADPQVHPGYDYNKPYTLPSGNPPFDEVASYDPFYKSPALRYAGRVCHYGGKNTGLWCGTVRNDGTHVDGEMFGLG